MALRERKDPYRNFKFLIEINGIVQAGFSEATVLNSTSEVIEYRKADKPTYVRKLSGLTKYGTLALKWGITNSLELYHWRKLVEQGKMKDARRNITLLLMDEKRNPVTRWEFGDAWVSKYDAPDLTSERNTVSIETLEIAFGTMERAQTTINR
jgi:phage tail-like protein